MISVSEDIFQELDFLAVSFLLGMLLVLVYDCLRIFRRLVRHGTGLIAIEDLCYWIMAAFVIFAMLYQKNEGLIRGFSIGGIVAGMFLYNQFISRYTVRCIAGFLEKVIHMVQKVWRLLSAPFRKAAKTVSDKGSRMADQGKKIIKYEKKRLKKIRKLIRIGISKK